MLLSAPLRFAAILCGACFLLCASGLADEARLQQQFEQANARLDAGDSAGAIEIYNAILEQMPQADNVLVNRAIAKSNLKDLSGARADLAQALSINDTNAEAYRVRSLLRFDAKDYPGSLADLDKAIRELPAEAQLLAMRGELHRTMKSWDLALVDFNRAIELDPGKAPYFFARGLTHEAKGDVTPALADFSRTLRLDPNHADAHYTRGWIRFHRLEWAEAIEDGRKTLELAPQAYGAVRLIGYALFARGDYAAAVEALTQAADLAQQDAEGASFALYIRHLALQRLGQPDRRLATSWGNWGEHPWFQAIARFLVGQLDEEKFSAAAAEAATDEQRQGQECELHFYIGMVRQLAGERSTARLRYQAAVATNRKDYIEYTLAAAELQRP